MLFLAGEANHILANHPVLKIEEGLGHHLFLQLNWHVVVKPLQCLQKLSLIFATIHAHT